VITTCLLWKSKVRSAEINPSAYFDQIQDWKSLYAFFRMSTNQASPKKGNARSPPESPRSSFMISPGQSPPGGRRYSLNLPPELIQQLERRRASLEKLQVDKISPWMHLYEFEAVEEKE